MLLMIEFQIYTQRAIFCDRVRMQDRNASLPRSLDEAALQRVTEA